jgi:hypothetical protein
VKIAEIIREYDTSTAPRTYTGFSGPQQPPPSIVAAGPTAVANWHTQMQAIGQARPALPARPSALHQQARSVPPAPPRKPAPPDPQTPSASTQTPNGGFNTLRTGAEPTEVPSGQPVGGFNSLRGGTGTTQIPPVQSTPRDRDTRLPGFDRDEQYTRERLAAPAPKPAQPTPPAPPEPAAPSPAPEPFIGV